MVIDGLSIGQNIMSYFESKVPKAERPKIVFSLRLSDFATILL